MFDRTNPKHLAALKVRLSVDRLAPYEVITGTPLDGLTLYEWNSSASAALYGTLQAVEVVLRNALHEQLSAWHLRSGQAGSWLDDPLGLLEARCHKDIADARYRVLQAGYVVPALRHAFKQLRPQRRREIHEPVERLNRLRNRIAHHEPIYRRDLVKDHADALKVVAAICPLTKEWVHQTSSVPATLALRPHIPVQRRDG